MKRSELRRIIREEIQELNSITSESMINEFDFFKKLTNTTKDVIKLNSIMKKLKKDPQFQSIKQRWQENPYNSGAYRRMLVKLLQTKLTPEEQELVFRDGRDDMSWL